MAYRNSVKINLDVPATRGWCLKYVDDGINAPSRKPNAQASYEQEVKNGNITFDLPEGVRLAGYLKFKKGQYTNLGHVFWAYKKDGKITINDSESASGARGTYGSIDELLAWFGAYEPEFIGYTYGIDGLHLVEKYEEPKPEPKPQPKPKPEGIKVGDLVVPTRLVDYTGTPLTQWDDNYTVTELKGDRAVLMARGAVWAAMNVKYLKKV